MMRVADRCRDGITGPKRNEAEGIAHLPPRARIDRSFTASFSSIWAKQEIAVIKRPYSNRGQFANPENGRVVDIGHSSGNPLSSTVDEILSRPQGGVSTFGALTMSSREIAELTGKRHDNVRRDVEAMARSLSLTFEGKSEASNGGRPSTVYYLQKRESLILVSGYNIVMRAAIIDRWQDLEAQAARQPAATSHEVTVSGLAPNAMGQFGGVVRNVLRRRDGEMIIRFEEAIDQAVIDYTSVAVPRLSSFVEEVASKHMRPFSDKLDQLIGAVEGMRRDMDARGLSDNELTPLPRMSLLTFRKMRGWSLQKMGEMVGVTASAVAKHERGLCIPAPFVVYRYSQVSGGRLTTDTFYDAYRARWGSGRPRSKSEVVIEGEGA